MKDGEVKSPPLREPRACKQEGKRDGQGEQTLGPWCTTSPPWDQLFSNKRGTLEPGNPRTGAVSVPQSAPPLDQ